MRSLRHLLKTLVRQALVSRDGADDQRYPNLQVSYYLGKVGDAVAWFPYGFHANVPAGTLSVMWNLLGNPEARVVLPGSPASRPRPLAAGEVVVYHPGTGTTVHLKNNGDVEVTTDTRVVINTGTDTEVNAGGDVTLDAQGDVNATAAGDVNITSTGGVVNISGQVSMVSSGSISITGSGAVTVSGGSVTLSGGVTVDSRVFLNHQHSGVQAGAGNTGGVV